LLGDLLWDIESRADIRAVVKTPAESAAHLRPFAESLTDDAVHVNLLGLSPTTARRAAPKPPGETLNPSICLGRGYAGPSIARLPR
jgi:hypothetical protein